MKTQMTSSLKILILAPAVLTFGLLSACSGSKSNPLEKYNGMQTKPATDDKPTIQTTVKSELFSIKVQGPNQVNVAQFTEGQESQVLIKVISNSASIQKFSVRLAEFDNTTRPELTETETPGVYSLKWAPVLGTIRGGTSSQSFVGQIEAVVVEALDPRLVGLVGAQDLTVTVSRNNSQPLVTGYTDIKKMGVDEGQEVPFTVDVTDPAITANDLRLPDVQISPYINSNTEAYRADGSHYLIFDDRRKENPEKLPKGVYRFHYILKVDQLPLDRDRLGHDIPTTTDVDMCFLIRAVSVVGTMSGQSQVCTKARYAAQPPAIAFDTSMPVEVKAGETMTLHVKISSEHPKSVISISKSAAIIASLTGQKEISCDLESADKKNSQICIIKWTPACVSTTTLISLTVKAESTLGNKVKSASATKSVSVLPTDECVVVTRPSTKGSK